MLDFRYRDTLGYNMESMNAYSAVVGWSLLEHVTIRAEYTHLDIDLVQGVTSAMREASDAVDSWGIEVGIYF
jgi:hypothetical protein